MVSFETITFDTVLKKAFQPKDFLGYLIAHAMKHVSLQLISNFQKAGYDISRPQWLVMAKCFHFEKEEEILQSHIVDMMMGDKTGATRAIDDLVKRGWVNREIHEQDRRNRVLTLTKEGETIVPELMKTVHATISQATKGIDPSELEITKKVLKQIIDNTQQSNS